jgi:hypothetical protein
MIDHVYEVAVELTVKNAEEPDKTPVEHVVSAIQRILEENGDEWLLEAIGHPHPEGFVVTAVDGHQQAEEAWMYRDLCD